MAVHAAGYDEDGPLHGRAMSELHRCEHTFHGAGLVPAFVLATFAADAHHSISAVYDSSRPQRLEGVVAEFQFVNPHPFVIVDADGESWRLEMDNRFELAGIGMTSETLKPGDRVVVTGSLGRPSRARSTLAARLVC
jgi:hypothetical protein